MKFFQATIFFILVSSTGLAHADEKLDKLVAKCEQIKEKLGDYYDDYMDDGDESTAYGQWHHAEKELQRCSARGGDCNELRDRHNSAKGKAVRLDNQMKELGCYAAIKKKEAEEKGL